MTTETEAQRLARLDKEACRNYRSKRNLQRSAVYRRAEAQEEWEKQTQDQAGAPATKPELKKP